MKRNSLAIILIIAVAILGGGVYILLKDTNGPVISLSPGSGKVSPKSNFVLRAEDPSGLREIIVRTVQGEVRSQVYVEKNFNATSAEINFPLGENTSLRDGAFELEVLCRDASFAGFGQGNPTTQQYNFVFDTQPPKVSILSPKNYLRRGGAGCLIYSISKNVMKNGVAVGDRFFPGYKILGDEYVCFFAFPYDVEYSDYSPTLVVEDYAGNQIIRRFSYMRIDRKFKEDTLNLPQSFLEEKSAEFHSVFPEQMSALDRYLKVNRELRDQNARTLVELGRKTADSALWQGAFMRMPESAPKAGFGDRRAYKYEGAVVDHQIHLGADLASLENSNIPAANSGRVIFAGDLGIYGQTVVIDHGLGVQSLYSHMSHIEVSPGQDVARGQVLGQTGMTGLAGGDHLHFGILIAGLPVSPIEWWDAHWIQDNIQDRMPMAAWPRSQLPQEQEGQSGALNSTDLTE